MIGGDDFEAAVLGEQPPAAVVARAKRSAGQARRRRDELAGAASRLRGEVPFIRSGRSGRPSRDELTDLSRDSALDWLHSCFGRDSASLMDVSACSKAALCSRVSSVRAQLVVAESLHAGMERELRDVVSTLQASHDARHTRVVTLKRLWDETALRVQMTDAAMRQLLGADFTDLVRASTGKRNRAPGLVIQSFQQMAHLRWGPAAEQACELVLPAKLLPGTSAQSIWAGLVSTLPVLNTDELHKLSLTVRALVLYNFPDGLAANRVCNTMMKMLVPRALCLMSHCVSHLLMLVWEAGTRKGMATTLYQMTQVLGHALSNSKVQTAMRSLALESDVIVGIRAAAADLRFNESVLDCTLRRCLAIGSFFCDADGSRHDPAAAAKTRTEVDEQCRLVQDGLTGPWSRGRVTHNCFGRLPGNRCCPDYKTARDKVRASLDIVASESVGSLKTLATNKWGSVSKCCTKIGLGVLVHNCLSSAFGRTLASKEEVARLKQLVVENLEQQHAAAARGEFGDDPNTFRVLRGKRILGSDAFLRDPGTPVMLLSFLIGSVPVDKLFQTFYECEHVARSSDHTGTNGRPKVGLLQSMASKSRDGILFITHSKLASPLFEMNSPYKHLGVIAESHGQLLTSGLRTSRGVQLRLSASFSFHFLGTFWQPEFDMLQILNDSLEEALLRVDKLMNPDQHGTCLKCEGLFLLRLRTRLAEPPALSEAERVEVVVEVFSSTASDPLVASMHLVEGLHAHARAGAARSMDRRKQLPRRLFASQGLVRWSELHKKRLRGKLRPVPTIRQAILKTKRVKEQPTSRILTGHDAYVKVQNRLRLRCFFCCSFCCPVMFRYKFCCPVMFCYKHDVNAKTHRRARGETGRASYDAHLQAVHSLWRHMSDEEKKPYEDQAEQGEMLRPPHLNVPVVDQHATHVGSPWGVGSLSYPCSPAIVQQHVRDLLPDAKPWLRSAYERCAQGFADGSTTYAQCVVNTVGAAQVNLKDVSQFEKANRTCFQMHPGLCVSNPLYSSILAFHAQLASAMQRLEIGTGNVDGTMLYLFAGYRRVRDAEAAGRRANGMTIKADRFDVAFVSDQPERRRKWRTWTRCRFVEGPEFNCPQHVGLINTDRQSLDEFWSFAWANRLRSACKYYWVHKLEYEDVEGEIHVVKASEIYIYIYIYI